MASPTFVRLRETDYTITDPEQDIRGRKALDRDGREIGEVKSLLIDEDELVVRFVELERGGFLGIGGRARLLPVEAIEKVERDVVQVRATVDEVDGSPPYDPELERDKQYFSDVYGYYGFLPY